MLGGDEPRIGFSRFPFILGEIFGEQIAKPADWTVF
jgi:hypothetical protein